jgi:nitroimidazol reductase NimA-like FMN-containing flavoprotein (pyridoxamine 5'-phosphate oxidase superfamily)
MTKIRHLTPPEIEAILREHQVGRIAFADQRRVDIEPISYVYNDGALYGRAAPGTRMQALAGRPWVAFEVDDIRGPDDWDSVVVKGTVYVVEPADMSPLKEQYERALGAIRSLTPEALTDRDPVPSRNILFRLHIDDMEGRSARQSADTDERP